MIPDFTEIIQHLQAQDAQREEVILLSRKIVKASKLAIYATHRKQPEEAQKHITAMEEQLTQLLDIVQKQPRLHTLGSTKVAIQEYVEAKTLLTYEQKKTIPSHKELKVDPEYYLLGICDLVGELSRMATNAAATGKDEEALQMKSTVEGIYGQFLQLDLGNGELRKKSDSIKYEVKKLENLHYEIALKQR